MKKLLGWCLKGVLGLAVLLVLFHLEENWRGKRAWDNWKATQEAKGVRYDWSQLAPPHVPDVDNFAKAPMVESAIRGTKELLPGIRWPNPQPRNASWRLGQRENFDAWTTGLDGEELESVWSSANADLARLADAVRRPQSSIVMNYGTTRLADQDLPVLLGFRAASRVLRIRALARLRAGQPESALDDVITNLRLARHLQEEPILISNLLQSAIISQSMQPIWEGLSDHQWNRAQLERLREELSAIDLIRSHRRAIEGERVFGAGASLGSLSLGSWARAKSLTIDVFEGELKERPLRAIAYLLFVPKGWIYQNAVSLDRFYSEAWLPSLDPAHHRVDLIVYEKSLHLMEARQRTPYTFISFPHVPILMTQSQRNAQLQNGLDEALIACALERYRIDKGAYPATLDALAPIYLAEPPPDVVTGQPLRYHPDPGGGFTLYSVGWDGKDDGGHAKATAEGALDLDHGDWPWPSPGK